jgi:hypothetical protein
MRFYEHMVAERPMFARFQRAVEATVWPFFAGGCHTARDRLAALTRAGFVVESCRRFSLHQGLSRQPR